MADNVLKYSLLENGLDFIFESLRGLCKLNSKNIIDDKIKKKILKYSLLHLSSGMELVFKNVLLEEHWTYVFQDMNKAQLKLLEQGGFKSVDNETILERLNNLCGINFTDKEKMILKSLREIRNRTEHFAVEYNVYAIESIIHKCISILIRVVAERYTEENMSDTEKSLHKEIKVLLKDLTIHNEDVRLLADKELTILTEKYDGEFVVMTCPLCNEPYLFKVMDEDAKCLFCCSRLNGSQIASTYIYDVLGITEYEVAKDGVEWPQYECPECGEEALVLDYKHNKYICFNCGIHKCVDEFNRCCDCGRLIDKNREIDLCTECWNYRVNRDD